MNRKKIIYNKEDQRLIVFNAYLKGYTPVEMASKLGITRQRAYQVIKENITDAFKATHELNRAEMIYNHLKLKAVDEKIKTR